MQVNNNYNYIPQKYPMSFKRNWQEHASWGARYIKESQKANFKLFTFPDAKAVFVEIGEKASSKFGNIKDRIVKLLAAQGSAFAINEVMSKDDETQIHQLENKGNGIFEAQNINAKENAQYRFIIIKSNNNNDEISLVKDPYAKKQPDINGWSEIYNPDNYEWKATDWLNGKDSRRIIRKPNEPLRGLENLVIEEINIPTLSEEGTFEKAKAHIDKIANKGIATAVEIMPVENTYSLQWGYDGVDKFAVNEKLGGAVELKKLIDYIHGKGLNVILDVVPNHMGPDGNYLTQTGPYIKGSGDFGDLLNYEGKDNKYVRDWMTNAALYWADEFKVDGIRFDMTKFCASDYLLKQIVTEVNEHFPNVFLIAEDGQDNKPSVTKYEEYPNSHAETLEMIDHSVDNIAYRNWKTHPQEIGFDSEWDFVLMKQLKNSLIEPYKINLDDMDRAIWNSKHRVKFVMSHDEIGNWDGTRLIPKVVAQELNLFNRVKGETEAERGQNAAKLAQKLTELQATGKLATLPREELRKISRELGLKDNQYIHVPNVEKAFNIGFAKQKLAIGCIMTIPGPKMYFQGEDSLALSPFKFFREFSNYKYDNSSINDINHKKGYNTLESLARPESLINKIKADENLEKELVKFNQDLSNIIKNSTALRNGEIIQTFKDIQNNVHAHQIKQGDEEFLIIKHFGKNFHTENYSFWNFPKGDWQEIFNSDESIYGGSDYVNKDRSINSKNQKLNLAPNSIIILRKV